MEARILKLAEDEGLPAIIEVNGAQLEAMDCFGYTCEVSEGDVLDVAFSIFVDREDDWDRMFSGNPNNYKKMVQLKGWSYKAYGEIISVNPVIVDCGVTTFEDVLHTHDPRCVGEFISFTIERLDIWEVENG